MGDRHATLHRVPESRLWDEASLHPFRWLGQLLTNIVLWEGILWHYIVTDKPLCKKQFRKRQQYIGVVGFVAAIVGYLILLYWKFEVPDATIWHLVVYLSPVQIVAGCIIVFIHRHRRFGGSD